MFYMDMEISITTPRSHSCTDLELEPPQFHSCMEISSESIISYRALGLFSERVNTVLKSTISHTSFGIGLALRWTSTQAPPLQPVLYSCRYPTPQ